MLKLCAKSTKDRKITQEDKIIVANFVPISSSYNYNYNLSKIINENTEIESIDVMKDVDDIVNDNMSNCVVEISNNFENDVNAINASRRKCVKAVTVKSSTPRAILKRGVKKVKK